MNEVSKKDVETKVREMTKEKIEPSKKSTKETTNETTKLESNKESNVKREKVICSGINKKGEACKSVGTIKPEGAKKKYCFRHAEDFRSFECDSDSSDEEEETENEITKETDKDNSKDNSDDELFEEKYN